MLHANHTLIYQFIPVAAGRVMERGDEVVGVDNLNDYYDVRLKEYRLEKFRGAPNFEFHAVDIEDRAKLAEIFARHRFDAVINLADWRVYLSVCFGPDAA